MRFAKIVLISTLSCLILQIRCHNRSSPFINSRCGLVTQPKPLHWMMNENRTELEWAPWLVVLFGNSSLQCDGTIVSERYILASAICAQTNLNIARMGFRRIGAGNYFSGKPPFEDYSILATLVHRDFNPNTFEHNIALVKLYRNISFGDYTQPICLLQDATYAPPPLAPLKSFGWGKPPIVLPRYIPVKKAVQTDHVKWDECLEDFKDRFYLTKDMICAKGEATDVYEYDSGGPLVTMVNYDGKYRFLALGIVSLGAQTRAGTCVYTFTPNYGDWILAQIKLFEQTVYVTTESTSIY